MKYRYPRLAGDVTIVVCSLPSTYANAPKTCTRSGAPLVRLEHDLLDDAENADRTAGGKRRRSQSTKHGTDSSLVVSTSVTSLHGEFDVQRQMKRAAGEGPPLKTDPSRGLRRAGLAAVVVDRAELTRSAIVSGNGEMRDTGPLAMSAVVRPLRLTAFTSAPFDTRY